MACLEMLAHHNVPFRRDVIERAAKDTPVLSVPPAPATGNLSTLRFTGTPPSYPKPRSFVLHSLALRFFVASRH